MMHWLPRAKIQYQAMWITSIPYLPLDSLRYDRIHDIILLFHLFLFFIGSSFFQINFVIKETVYTRLYNKSGIVFIDL